METNRIKTKLEFINGTTKELKIPDIHYDTINTLDVWMKLNPFEEFMKIFLENNKLSFSEFLNLKSINFEHY